jgi:hypothetical protein
MSKRSSKWPTSFASTTNQSIVVYDQAMLSRDASNYKTLLQFMVERQPKDIIDYCNLCNNLSDPRICKATKWRKYFIGIAIEHGLVEKSESNCGCLWKLQARTWYSIESDLLRETWAGSTKIKRKNWHHFICY